MRFRNVVPGQSLFLVKKVRVYVYINYVYTRTGLDNLAYLAACRGTNFMTLVSSITLVVILSAMEC